MTRARPGCGMGQCNSRPRQRILRRVKKKLVEGERFRLADRRAALNTQLHHNALDSEQVTLVAKGKFVFFLTYFYS